MFSLILGFAIAASSGSKADYACLTERLRPFVSPTGIHQAWPRASQLPAHLADDPGTLISDQGSYEDGYSHWVIVDRAVQAAYVVRRGGFAGQQVVFGPLPVASCAQVPPNNSFKQTPLRGAA